MRRGLILFIALLLLAPAAWAQITAISDIQTVPDPEADDASPLVGQTVTIQGWVTFESMSMGGNKFYVADAPGAWSGIYVYTGDTDYELGFGWEVEVTGEVTEYYGLTEFDASAGTVTVLSDSVDWTNLPAAVAYTDVTLAELQTVAGAEPYESVLIRISDPGLNCVEAPNNFGEWDIGDGTNSVAVDNPADAVFGYYFDPVVDMPFEYVQGVLNYTYSEYKILPEIAHDLKVAEDPDSGWYTPIWWFQQVRPMDMAPVEDANGTWAARDESYSSSARYDGQVDPDTVTIHGIVTMPSGLSYAGAGVKFIFSDYDTPLEGAPWSAVLSYDPDSTTFPQLFVGDEIVVTGYISEYNTSQSNMTELFVTEPVQFLSPANPVPEPVPLTTAEVRDPQIVEQYGTVFIKVYNSSVTNDNLNFELFAIDDDLGDDVFSALVDDDSDSMTGYQVPPIGTLIDSLWGWIYHHYGSMDPATEFDWAYKIEPLYPADIVIGEGPPNFLSVARDPGTPGADEVVTVDASISDNSAVISASIMYRIADGDWQEAAMTNVGGIDWEGEIPAQPAGTDIWYYLVAEDDNSTTTTSPSDIETELYGYVTNGTDLTIQDVQYTVFEYGPSRYEGYQVTVSGVVTDLAVNAAEFGNSTYGNCYFIQTGTDAPFSGLAVMIPEGIATPAMGDEITVTGTIDESGEGDWNFKWGNLTRMVDVIGATIDASGQSYETYDVTCAEVNAALESYESVVVKFTDAEITSVNSYDWTFTDASGETMLLDDDMLPDGDPALDLLDAADVGTTFDIVQGVLVYTFGSWKVELRDQGDLGVEGVSDEAATLPTEFALEQNYPNPFNPSTTISYAVPVAGNVKVLVYNHLGQLVRTLVDADQRAGSYSVYWNGRNEADAPVASGTYFLRLVADNRQLVRKMVLVK